MLDICVRFLWYYAGIKFTWILAIWFTFAFRNESLYFLKFKAIIYVVYINDDLEDYEKFQTIHPYIALTLYD